MPSAPSTRARTAASSTRMNGLVASSLPIVDGTVGSPRARRAWASATAYACVCGVFVYVWLRDIGVDETHTRLHTRTNLLQRCVVGLDPTGELVVRERVLSRDRLK